MRRIASTSRASWADIPPAPGIYLVLWSLNEPPQFSKETRKATYTNPLDPKKLQEKWIRICAYSPTDIIYIGKADSLRRRVRALARFGIGRAKNHRGGEWIWQISRIITASVMVQSCPISKQNSFENSLLEKFYKEHHEFPIGNRKGPEGDDRWFPE